MIKKGVFENGIIVNMSEENESLKLNNMKSN